MCDVFKGAHIHVDINVLLHCKRGKTTHCHGSKRFIQQQKRPRSRMEINVLLNGKSGQITIILEITFCSMKIR